MIALTALCVAPLIRRRQALVDQREEAIARVSGHVADSLMNMDTVRAFAAEEREAAEHRSRVAESRRLTLRSWDYGNLRIDTLVAPMSVLTNALGLLLAVTLGGGGHGVEAVVVAFTYYSNATRIMFEFNQIYRRLESSMTEAAQFTELLLTPPTVLDPASPEPLLPAGRRRPLRAGDLRPRGREAALRGPRPGCAQRGEDRSRRPVRRRQDHAQPAAAADDGHRRRPDPDRRTGHQQAAPGRPAQPDRLRAAGPGDVPPHAAGQHRVRPAGRHRRRDPPRGRGGARHGVRRRAAGRLRHHGGRARQSSCPADSASGSPSPGRSCATRRSCCSTRRPAPWTPRARSSSRRRCGGSWRGGRRSWWRTG